MAQIKFLSIHVSAQLKSLVWAKPDFGIGHTRPRLVMGWSDIQY